MLFYDKHTSSVFDKLSVENYFKLQIMTILLKYLFFEVEQF